LGPGIRSCKEDLMVEPVEFPSEITLAKHEALDLVAA
jgi:hypothetical protein